MALWGNALAKSCAFLILGAGYPDRGEMQKLPPLFVFPGGPGEPLGELPALKPLFFLVAERAQRGDLNHTSSAASF
jgi:hypothetical protein